jgi:hypothetical protein
MKILDYCGKVTNALTCNNAIIITTVKCFIVQTLGPDVKEENDTKCVCLSALIDKTC